MLHRLPPFNLCISNVPGPNVPVYLGGAKLIAHYPVSVITDGQGLNITLVGYLGQLHFGLVACRELVPDLDALAGYLVDELARWSRPPTSAPEPPPANYRRPTRAPADELGPLASSAHAVTATGYPQRAAGGNRVPAQVPAPVFAAAVSIFLAGRRLDMRSLARAPAWAGRPCTGGRVTGNGCWTP